MTGFLGQNGAGKTTTVRILATLISPTAGLATVAGIPVGPDGAAKIQQRMTVTENLEDLRAELFAASLDITVATALPDPGRIFGGLPAVQGIASTASIFTVKASALTMGLANEHPVLGFCCS